MQRGSGSGGTCPPPTPPLAPRPILGAALLPGGAPPAALTAAFREPALVPSARRAGPCIPGQMMAAAGSVGLVNIGLEV